MNHTIQQCLEVLNKKPKWFFQRENNQSKLACLKIIEEKGTPSDIYWLIKMVKNNNKQIRERSVEVINHLFSKLIAFDDYHEALRHVPLTTDDIDYYHQHMEQRNYLLLLAIASLNSNGYVREKAVRELGRMQDAGSIQFIILRLSDWVAQVRAASASAIDGFLQEKYLPQLLKHLPLIHSLLRKQRTDLRDAYEGIIHFIFAPQYAAITDRVAQQLEDKTRWYYYRHRLSIDQLNSQHLTAMASDKYFLIRLEVLRCLSGYPMEIQQQIGKLFLQDKSPSLRLEAMHKLLPQRSDNQELLYDFISDQSAAVRDRSRRMLGNATIDFTQLYRERVSGNYLLTGSLLGLFETGDIRDLPLLISNINNQKTEVVIGALVAMNRIDRDQARIFSLRLINHPVKRVRNKAVEILAKQANEETLSELRRMYTTADTQIKQSLLSLYHKIGDWKIIGDLLLAAGDQDMAEQQMAWEMMAKWKIKAVRLFTAPTMADRQRADDGYRELQQKKWGVTPARNKLLADLKFFLS